MMQLRAANVADAESLERIRVRGWEIGYRRVFPPAELDALAVDPARWVDWLSRGFEHGQTCVVVPRTRRFYEAAGWRVDGTTGMFERLGVRAPIVRYAKRLSNAASRS